MDVFVIIGVVGLISLLFAFYLAESGKITTTLRKYTILNAVGSLFLIIYSVHIKAWVFTALNIIWFFVALLKLIFPYRNQISPHNRRSRKRE